MQKYYYVEEKFFNQTTTSHTFTIAPNLIVRRIRLTKNTKRHDHDQGKMGFYITAAMQCNANVLYTIEFKVRWKSVSRGKLMNISRIKEIIRKRFEEKNKK